MPMDPITWFLAVGQRYTENIKQTAQEMTPQKWVHIVTIVGGYILLRSMAMKLMAARQMKQHTNESAETELRYKQELTANDLRGPGTAKVSIPGEDDDDVAETSMADWGTKARKRQRVMLRKLLEAEEKRLAEQIGDDEDKDIEEFLET